MIRQTWDWDVRSSYRTLKQLPISPHIAGILDRFDIAMSFFTSI